MDQNTKRSGYRIDLRAPHDSQITTRNCFARWMAFIITVVVVLGVPALFLGYWGWFLGNGTIATFSGLIGFCVGGEFLARMIPNRMFVYNPEWTGYVTQNAFTGTMVPYGPGLHLSHWWEARNKSGNYSLKVITRDFKVNIQTATARADVSGMYEYAINLAKIERAIGIHESTIESGLTAFIKSFLISRCAAKDAESVRGSISELNESLAQEYMDEKGVENPSSFGTKYGFITVSIVIDNIAFSETVQKTRDAIDKAAALHEIVSRLYGFQPKELAMKLASGEIPVRDYNAMLNRAMATSENAKMDINVIEADIPALIGKLTERFTQGGTP